MKALRVVEAVREAARTGARVDIASDEPAVVQAQPIRKGA
jgi:hypothetical protein